MVLSFEMVEECRRHVVERSPGARENRLRWRPGLGPGLSLTALARMKGWPAMIIVGPAQRGSIHKYVESCQHNEIGKYCRASSLPPISTKCLRRNRLSRQKRQRERNLVRSKRGEMSVSILHYKQAASRVGHARERRNGDI